MITWHIKDLTTAVASDGKIELCLRQHDLDQYSVLAVHDGKELDLLTIGDFDVKASVPTIAELQQFVRDLDETALMRLLSERLRQHETLH